MGGAPPSEPRSEGPVEPERSQGAELRNVRGVRERVGRAARRRAPVPGRRRRRDVQGPRRVRLVGEREVLSGALAPVAALGARGRKERLPGRGGLRRVGRVGRSGDPRTATFARARCPRGVGAARGRGLGAVVPVVRRTAVTKSTIGRRRRSRVRSAAPEVPSSAGHTEPGSERRRGRARQPEPPS